MCPGLTQSLAWPPHPDASTRAGLGSCCPTWLRMEQAGVAPSGNGAGISSSPAPVRDGGAWGCVWIQAGRQPEAVHESSATAVTVGAGCE